jgi:hypothetical protein
MLIGRLRIILIALPLNDLQGTGWTNIQAGSHAVTKNLSHEDRLIFLIELQSSFHTCRRAQPATVAQVPVDFNDLPLCHDLILLSEFLGYNIL